MTISIIAERIFNIGGLAVNNSLLTSWIVILGLIILALFFHLSSPKKIPKGLQNILETIIEALANLVENVAGNKKEAKIFLPFIATFFIFIILNNWFGLLPGVGSIGFREVIHGKEELIPFLRAGTSDLNLTIALAFITFAAAQILGIWKLGFFKYIQKFINFKSPMGFFVGLLESISEFSKIISFSFRLFGNIFAGEVLLIVMMFLVPVIVPLPFYALEIFVGFIQALVFALLSLVFFKLATLKNEH